MLLNDSIIYKLFYEIDYCKCYLMEEQFFEVYYKRSTLYIYECMKLNPEDGLLMLLIHYLQRCIVTVIGEQHRYSTSILQLRNSQIIHKTLEK